jgi:hypothetical protein
VQRGTGKLAVAVEPHPGIQTDLLSNVVERVVGHRSVWLCGRHWLEFLQPVPSPRRQPFRFEDVEQQIPRIQSGTAGYMNCTAHHSRRPISHAGR